MRIAGGKLPTREEVQFVLHAADVQHHNDSIDMDELADTIKIWKNYLDNKPIIEGVFQEFGKHVAARVHTRMPTRVDFLCDALQPPFYFLTSADPLKPVVLTDEDKSGKIELSELTR